MNVMHAWAIGLGVLGLAAPVAVHLLTRPQPIDLPLSTVRFLQEVIQQRRARSRLRDWLILLIRILCIGLLAFALARPSFESSPLVIPSAQGDIARVIVVDCSQSMLAGSGGVTCWTQAQAAVVEYLDLGRSGFANVIFCGAQSRPVFDRFSKNLPALREAVRQGQAMAERADPRAALEDAAKMLDGCEAERKQLILVSDFQRSNWGVLPLDQIPAGTEIQFHSVEAPTGGNVAISAVRFSNNPVIDQASLLEIDIANYSERTAEVSCQIEMSGQLHSIQASVEPMGHTTVSKSLVFDQSGWKHGWVRLLNHLDCLSEDDQRPCAVFVRSPMRLALITRQAAQQIPSSSFYLQRAIDVAFAQVGDSAANGSSASGSSDSADSSVVSRLIPGRDDLRNWPSVDAYVLDHAGSLDSSTIVFLANQLRRGKAVLWITSELADAVSIEHLQQNLGNELQTPVKLMVPSGGQARKDLMVGNLKTRAAPFAILGSQANAAMNLVRIGGGLPTQTLADANGDQVLAELSDTSMFIYRTSVGAGEFAVINADLGRSNWPMQPTFLPVLSELLRTLIDQSVRRQQAAPGELLVRMLPAEVDHTANIVGQTIDGTPPLESDYGKWEWSAEQKALIWSWPNPQGPGVYGLFDRNATDDHAVWMEATAAPESEADLRVLDREVLTTRISDSHRVGYTRTGQEQGRDDTLWGWLIVACSLGLICEVVALRLSQM